jgi:hypothetical protein
VEPVIRESLLRLAAGSLPEGTDAVGGYWTRTNDPEIDLVGADREPIAKKITMVGSVKWLENKPAPPRPASSPSAPKNCSPHGNPSSHTKARPCGRPKAQFGRLRVDKCHQIAAPASITHSY